jgi:hypothetical protein
MRSIQVSTDVFAAIWAARVDGEPTEDAILHRVLKVKSGPTSKRDLEVTFGFRDTRFGVSLPAGFEIFRTYLGKEYRAQAVQGVWILGETGIGYTTLNELSNAIGASRENAWGAWFYMDGKKRRPISDLRDQTKIVHRERRASK